MVKINPALVKKRREEIIQSARSLYETMPYWQITFKDVAQGITFGRSSIYNYFHTKEEIFLGVLRKEYELWNEDIQGILKMDQPLDIDGYAKALAKTIAKREIMLKLLAMNICELENHSRKENLVEFKIAYGSTIDSINQTLSHYFPNMSETDHVQFIYLLYPYLMGVYNYTHIEPDQKEAMEQAKVPHHVFTTEALVESLIKRILASF